MTAHLPIERAAMSQAPAWRLHLAALGMVAAALLVLFRADAVDMVRIWNDSSTFNHCFLILPITAWLVWQRLPELRRLVPSIWFPGVAVTAAGAATWLLGEAGGLALLRHAGLVLMLQGTVVAALGKPVARALAFPLFYMIFLAPFGEELVPPLQLLTARMCMALLDLIGIPAHLEGVFISTPTGLFEVAEACSGINFLVAMLAYGALVANLCFRSWPRRAAFMLAAVAIPIIANGVRAWGTIVVASFAGIEFASGFDHILYGWIFFAIVIALLMAAGWRFFDRRPTDPWFDPARLQPKAEPMIAPVPLAGVAVALLLVSVTPIGWTSHLAAAAVRSVPETIAMPTVSGWQQTSDAAKRRWQPRFDGADLVRGARFRDREGRTVDLVVALFASQREGAEPVAFGQGSDDAWRWIENGPPPSGGRLDRIGSFGTVREVATFYRVGAILAGDPLAVKLETMKTRLLGGPQHAVVVMVSSEAPVVGVSPRPVIDAFLSALGPIETFADRAAGG
jgi:exosortase A